MLYLLLKDDGENGVNINRKVDIFTDDREYDKSNNYVEVMDSEEDDIDEVTSVFKSLARCIFCLRMVKK